MKHFSLFLLMFPVIIFAQSKINKNNWIGKNDEYFKISKQTATFVYGAERIFFDVVKFKKKYFILAETDYSFKTIRK